MGRILKKVQKIENTIKENDYLKIILAYAFFFTIFSLMYFTLNSFAALDDPFFHIRFAEIFRSEGLNAFRNFHWLYFSKISIHQSYFIYYNFLFYIILIPFTFVHPLFLGIKLYAVVFLAIYFTLLYYVLLKLKERYAFFWVIIFLAIMSSGSIWRFFEARPYALAPVLLVFEVYLLHKKKYLGVFLLSFLYLYWHSVTFFFPLVVAVIYFAFDAFYNDNKLNWKIIWCSLSGTILSVLVLGLFAPGFFSFINDIYIRMFVQTIIGKKVAISEGSELYGANFLDFLRSNMIILSLLSMAIVFEIYRYLQEKNGSFVEMDENEKNKRPLRGTLFFMTLGFFMATFISQRNGDFFTFFSAAYIVISVNYFLARIQITDNLVKKSMAIGFVVVVVYLFSANLLSIYASISSSSPYNAIEGTADWLKKNTKPGDIVFNANWGWFTTLYYYDTQNYYIAGIEPRFLYNYSHDMYWEWWHISNDGYVCTDQQCDQLNELKKTALRKDASKKEWYQKEGDLAAAIIKNDFKSRYIVTSVDMKNFDDLMDNNSHFKKVFTDNIYNQYFVYEVN